MKIKVCGMRDPENIAAVGRWNPDYMGFIFYDRSPRFAGNLDPAALDVLSEGVLRVGVFVDAPAVFVRQTAERYRLDLIQLHGDETPEYCLNLRRKIPVIKAFGVANAGDPERALRYEGACDYFLFDAKTPQRGGAGVKFDRRLLDSYRGDTPYFLSGGIGPEDALLLRTAGQTRCVAADINSRFETAPALKDAEAVGRFIRNVAFFEESQRK
jgi:phosphoribosylanthranilate isomerase